MYFIEKLTVCSWLFSILPEIKRYAKADQHKGKTLLYYVDASCQGLSLSRFMSNFLKVEIKRLDFTFFDAKDNNGDSLWLKAIFEDLADVQKFMSQYPALQERIKRYEAEEYLRFFLMKRLLYFNSDLFTLMRIVLLFRVASLKQGNAGRINFFLFSYQRPWLSVVKKWAKAQNVDVIPMRWGCGFSIQKTMVRLDFIKYAIKQAMFAWMGIKQKALGIVSHVGFKAIQDLSPKIAVEFYGHLNLDSPGLNSDLFFCQQRCPLNKDILLYFQHPQLRVSDKEWDEIEKHGMSGVVINPRATATSRIPLFNYKGKLREEDRPKVATNDKGKDDDIERDLRQQVMEYYKQKDYWYNFFLRHNIRIHVTWVRIETRSFPRADALQSLGGVTVVYQRSFEYSSNPWLVTKADVVFGFSKFGAHLGKDMDSVIPYYVLTGYLGDYRFPIVKKEASVIRDGLRRHGAKRILAYFDEESYDDPRWDISHKDLQKEYAFLLKKVLNIPSLGLIIKPKICSTLRKRLGDVVPLLDRAIESGRCHIFEESEFHFGSYPPAIAALTSDIAIHGCLLAGTAGIESALTGTPTLMLDREGSSKSPLYKLGEGRVIFKNWDDLWKACLDHWGHLDGMPGFGDWSPMLDELDPFRDGRAAQRMGTYLEWISQGLKAKVPREAVLADAAQRYVKIWGKDKVLAINSR